MTVQTVDPTRDNPAIKCPRHQETMRRFLIGSVEIDRCGVCGGIWLDLGELQRLLESGEDIRHAIGELDHWVQPEDPSVGSPPVCPRDHAPLTQVRDPKQPHIQYDLCTHCGGLFFDAGELADLSEFTLKERLRWLFPGLRG
ncbi:MAG: zf-TFIIB domain-containing protein [Phycisphaeraceae bacterium]|nr:MAG: zf-TFIIB domain-containing protein [Phycisphaeraceae bacterium]